GTTISKVGDINQDGFNDLVVAAPFEGNGAIYIYHGGANGLPAKHSQKISAPHNSLQANQMFGHGLSKGADVDGNNYLDIAVGSPNAETVYIYKSYPIIRVNATISPFSQEIQTTDKSFKFNVCWLYESSFPIAFDVHFNATVRLDGQLGRAVFQDKRNQYGINSKITSDEQCILLEAFVTFSAVNIFRPIELEMTHHVLNDISNNNSGSSDDNNAASETQAFCGTCVAVNPNDSKTIKSKIVFSTGCRNARCTADLKIKSSLENVPSLPYILGSSSSLTMAYSIENSGETAYLAQIRIVLPEADVLFTKTPSNCKLDDTAPNSNVMECDLNNGFPLYTGNKTSIIISVDITKLDSSELVIRANVFSAGDEQNEVDNEDEKIIPLQKFSKIEILGDSTKNQITLQTEVEKENVSHTFE
ncbi:integrin alpha-PS3-like, partial [Sitodiplosis mosellana]|uniref:integrin alpha-PS3-like n=1 Tax=Sitodiplosis mosellana TaxID=263140 RepID=UPI0024446508